MKTAHLFNATFSFSSPKPIGSMVESLLGALEAKGAKVYQRNMGDYWVVESNLSFVDFFRVSKEGKLGLTESELSSRVVRISL